MEQKDKREKTVLTEEKGQWRKIFNWKNDITEKIINEEKSLRERTIGSEGKQT
jgi:hypothetical protein